MRVGADREQHGDLKPVAGDLADHVSNQGRGSDDIQLAGCCERLSRLAGRQGGQASSEEQQGEEDARRHLRIQS
jgi:hypothetical protein